eukprot:2404462-Amphidinium_carterae.1
MVSRRCRHSRIPKLHGQVRVQDTVGFSTRAIWISHGDRQSCGCECLNCELRCFESRLLMPRLSVVPSQHALVTLA